MPLLHLLAEKGVDPGAVLFSHGESVYLLPPGGQLIDDGYVQISVDHQSQRPGDGGSGQDQHMGIFSLLPQGGALIDAEAVLLVGDHQSQPVIDHVLCQQGVGADAHVDLPGRQTCQQLPPIFGLGGAGEQGASQAKTCEERGQVFVVLSGQDLGGCHHGALPAVPGGEPDAGGCHHGLAAAYVALAEPVHRTAAGHITGGVASGESGKWMFSYA